MKKKKRNWKKIFTTFVFFSFIIPLGFLIYRICTAPGSIPEDVEFVGRLKSDYVLMFVQCLLGVFAMIMPSILSKKFKLEIPSNMYLIFFGLSLLCYFSGRSAEFLLCDSPLGYHSPYVQWGNVGSFGIFFCNVVE